MRTIKVTKDSQVTFQPPPYMKDSGKTKASNFNNWSLSRKTC